MNSQPLGDKRIPAEKLFYSESSTTLFAGPFRPNRAGIFAFFRGAALSIDFHGHSGCDLTS